jgi:two-component system nitrogen regulation response regulator NtrX
VLSLPGKTVKAEKGYERCGPKIGLLQSTLAAGGSTGGPLLAHEIMVIDDDPDIREVLTIFLRKFGYVPLVFDSAAPALDCLATRRPSLILLDLMMEPMSGIQFLEELANRFPRVPRIPVLILSAYALSDEDRNRYRDWIAGVLKKPILPSDLRREIETRI